MGFVFCLIYFLVLRDNVNGLILFLFVDVFLKRERIRKEGIFWFVVFSGICLLKGIVGDMFNMLV